uniref:Ribosomal protein L10 n=1 Tax=Closterium baillyanum TaxID=1416941 RepID=U5YDW6_9VIRI|nr:ribosomal protein L10 [Closterium baillyanum]AGZ90279.1 ribosomal protein L10 [Closterium baillyanum]
MKIRKLILKAKLQQIEKQYQYVFIYHCSGPSGAQWRQLKDLLYKTHGKTFFHTKVRPTGERDHGAQHGDKRPDEGAVAAAVSSLCSGTTYYKVPSQGAVASAFSIGSKELRTTLSYSARDVRLDLWERPDFRKARSVRSAMDQLNSKLASLSGPFCIFYLRSCVGDEVATAHQSTASWSEVVKKIDSLGAQHLVLLYAQIKSTIVNHIDIKQALNLFTRSVYQQFLWSTQYPVQTLDFCLHQNIIAQVRCLEVLGHRHGGAMKNKLKQANQYNIELPSSIEVPGHNHK